MAVHLLLQSKKQPPPLAPPAKPLLRRLRKEKHFLGQVSFFLKHGPLSEHTIQGFQVPMAPATPPTPPGKLKPPLKPGIQLPLLQSGIPNPGTSPIEKGTRGKSLSWEVGSSKENGASGKPMIWAAPPFQRTAARIKAAGRMVIFMARFSGSSWLWVLMAGVDLYILYDDQSGV